MALACGAATPAPVRPFIGFSRGVSEAQLEGAAVEHVFAHQKNRFGLFIRTIGLAHAEARLTLCNLAYNFNRLIFHERQESKG